MLNQREHPSSPSLQRPKSPVECAIERLVSNITACEASAAGLGDAIKYALVDIPMGDGVAAQDQTRPATSLLVDQINAAATRVEVLSNKLNHLQNCSQL